VPSEKSQRVAERKALRNLSIRSAVRTARRKGLQAAQQGASEAEARVKQAVAGLDRAARKRIMHPNKVARDKSRLMRALRANQAIAEESPPEAVPSAPSVKKPRPSRRRRS